MEKQQKGGSARSIGFMQGFVHLAAAGFVILFFFVNVKTNMTVAVIQALQSCLLRRCCLPLSISESCCTQEREEEIQRGGKEKGSRVSGMLLIRDSWGLDAHPLI